MERMHRLKALETTQVLSGLAAFAPHVVGTPPLGLELPASDIDVIRFAPDAEAFACVIRNVFAAFVDADWMIEIFGHAPQYQGRADGDRW